MLTVSKALSTPITLFEKKNAGEGTNGLGGVFYIKTKAKTCQSKLQKPSSFVCHFAWHWKYIQIRSQIQSQVLFTYLTDEYPKSRQLLCEPNLSKARLQCAVNCNSVTAIELLRVSRADIDSQGLLIV